MSDNINRYRQVRNALERLYPTKPKGNLARNLNTLAAMISGIVGSKSTQLPQIAGKIPLAVKAASIEKRIKRWLINDFVDLLRYQHCSNYSFWRFENRELAKQGNNLP